MKGDYGDKLISSLDCAVLIDVPRQVRLQRVRDRSYQKFGARILPGGDLYEKENAWFSLVDSRPEDYAARWVESLACPVLRVDGALPAAQNVDYLLSILA